MFSPRNARIVAFFVASSFLFGTTAQTGAAKAQAPAKASEAAKQKRDYSGEAVVVEQLSNTYRFERDGTGQREMILRVKVQSDAGVERFGQLIFGYSSATEKLDMDYVRVRKADGTVVNAAASDIQDLTAPIAREAPIYTDQRQKHITVPGLRPGDQLEYRMVWNIHTALAQNHFWVEHNFITRGTIILNDELTVNMPAASKVKLKTEPGFQPSIKEENDRRVYPWKHSQPETRQRRRGEGQGKRRARRSRKRRRFGRTPSARATDDISELGRSGPMVRRTCNTIASFPTIRSKLKPKK